MDRCFVFGCSQAAGFNMVKHLVDSEEWQKNHGELYNSETYGYHHSYPVKIARALGYHEIHNHAVVGGSADAMSRIFGSIIDTIDTKDIVMACWPGGPRSEYWNEEEQDWVGLIVRRHQPEYYTLFKPSSVALQGVPCQSKTSHLHRSTHRKWILSYSWIGDKQKLTSSVSAFNELAEQHGIRVCNIFSWLPPDQPIKNDVRRSDLDRRAVDHARLSRWWWPVGTTNTFGNFADTHGYVSIDGHGHYDESVHTAFAEWVLKHIDESA